MRYFSLFLFFAMLVFTGCEKSSLFLQPDSSSFSVNPEKVAKEFTQELHSLLKEKEFRNTLTGALHSDQGKREILLIDFLEKPVNLSSRPNVKNVRDFFTLNQREDSAKSQDDIDILLESLISIYPDLELKFPDAWSDQEFEEATNLPISYHLEKGVPATYNTLSDNGWTEVDAVNPPTSPHFFISRSEDYKLILKNSSKWNDINCVGCSTLGITPVYESNTEALYTSNDYRVLVDYSINNKPPGGGGGGGGGGGVDDDGGVVIDFRSEYPCPEADRETNNDKDNLFRLRFSNKDALDDAFLRDQAWGNVDIELVLTVFFAVNGEVSQLTKEMSIKKRWLRRNPLFGSYELLNYTANLEIFTWQDEINGSAMTYSWYEDDGGDQSGSFTTNFSTMYVDPDNPGSTIATTTMVTIPVSSSDEVLGSSIVEYCDTTEGDGEEYNTGKLIFLVNQF